MHWRDLSVAHIDDSNVPLLVSLLTPVQSWQPSHTWLDNLTTRGLVVCSSSCLTVWQDKVRELWRLKPLNVVLTANSCSKQVVSPPHNRFCLTCPIISSAGTPLSHDNDLLLISKDHYIYKECTWVKARQDADTLHSHLCDRPNNKRIITQW